MFVSPTTIIVSTIMLYRMYIRALQARRLTKNVRP